MKIIGIDPSYTRTAVAMLDGDEATWWTVGTTPKQPLPERLRTIAMEVSEIVADNAPDHVVIEEPGFIYVYRGTGTVAVQRAIGAIIAGLPDVPITVVAVATVRKLLDVPVKRGKGMAKAAVVDWVEAQGITLPRSPVAKNPDHDVADALLLAHYGRDHL